MACALTQDITLDCRDSAGGIKNLYIIEFDNVTGITSSSGTISAIAKANGGQFYRYNLTRDTAEAMEEFNDSVENGTSFNKQTVNFIINKMQVSMRNEIALLAQNRLLIIVEDRNSKYWLYGEENGLMREGGKAGTGKAMGDRNGYEFTFTGNEKNMAKEVNSGIITGLMSP